MSSIHKFPNAVLPLTGDEYLWLSQRKANKRIRVQDFADQIQALATAGTRGIDGGFSPTLFLPTQSVEGGNSSSVYLPTQLFNGGNS